MARALRAYSRTIGLAVASSFVIALALLFAPGAVRHARAYCRLTSVKPLPGELCSSQGVKASWQRSCILVSLTDPGPMLPSVDLMRGAVDAAFGAWTAADC